MKIAFVTSESVPYASTGGLGEVCGALPAALASLGHEVIQFMPLYRHVAEGDIPLEDAGFQVSVPMGQVTRRADVVCAERNGIRTYFIGRDEYFDRSHLYSLPQRDYEDNFERFVFFQKAAVEVLDFIRFNADIVHAHDWQSALMPLFLHFGAGGLGRSDGGRSVLTIHNLAYQGVFPASAFGITNLPRRCFTVDSLEYYGQISCLKGGALAADMVTTVSETYAREIQTEAMGYGLHGVLSGLGDRLVGIANGIDYRNWNPATDPLIAERFSADTTGEGKAACKDALLREFDLPSDPQIPLFGMVTRLVDMKGLDLLEKAMPKLMKKKVAIVLLGSGQEKYHALCRQWAERWPGKFACRLEYNAGVAHRVYAGSDLYLMPSRVEPCGLGQIYGMRYGAVPVVHTTGGLADTVEDLSPDGSTGTGVRFDRYDAASLLGAIQRAIGFYRAPGRWKRIGRRIMEQDFTWTRSAREYVDVYSSLLD